ncbi:G patch domain-containing protein 8 isoform X2 [Amblyraja radiata]|uniref:G patch domain-containing protein 8 isoform X2 n=1 Tax=Amblyraja radiata TaxID=386614 RepID=UPI0014041D13|nr:G patch domain-containing protein 8 isoform X2 [Amblyraja radiata]
MADKFARFNEDRDFQGNHFDQYEEGHLEIEQASLDKPIESDNIGHRLLQKHGWKLGQGLGKSLQGRTDPIPIIVKYDVMGMGRMEMELDYADDATERRRVMEVEKQDTEELRQKYKDYAEKEKAIAKALEDLRANFYCELCDKQYQKHHEFDNHINSYDHAHKQRLKDLKQREFARNVASKSRKDEKKQERALRRFHELAELRKQQECAPGSGPMFKTTTVAIDEEDDDRNVVDTDESTGGKTSGPTSPSVNRTVPDNTVEDYREEDENISYCITGNSAGLDQSNQPVQPFNIAQLKNNSGTPFQKLGVSFSFAKKAAVKLDVSASVFSDVAEEPSESEAASPEENVSSGQVLPKSMEVETPVVPDKVEAASPSESENDSINNTLSKLKKMMGKEDDACQSEPEYYHYIPPAHCKVKPNFPFLLFMKATEELHRCDSKKTLETTKNDPDLQTTLRFQESSEELEKNETPALQQSSDTVDGGPDLDPDPKEDKSPEAVSKQNCSNTPSKPRACEEGKPSKHLVNKEILTGPKQLTGPFFPVLGKDDSTTLQWPSELLMVTKSEPCISYSCNPLYFEFKLTRNRDTKGKNKERCQENVHEHNAQSTGQESQETMNINTSKAPSKTVGAESDVKPLDQPPLTVSKGEAQIGETDKSTNKKNKGAKSHKHKKKKKHKKSGKHLKEKAGEEKEKPKDGETHAETSKKRKKRKHKSKNLDEKSKETDLELSVAMAATKSTEESSSTQKKRRRSQDCQHSAAAVEDASKKADVSEEPVSKKQKTGSGSELKKRTSGRKDSRSRHRSRESSRDEESDSYDESHAKRSRQKSSSHYSDEYDSRSERSYPRRSRRHRSSSQRSSHRSYSSGSDVSSDCSRYSRRRSYSDSYSDYSGRSNHSKRSHGSDYDYRRSRHREKKHKYSSSDDDYRRNRSRSRSSSRESARTRSRSRTRSSSHSRSRSKRRSHSTTQRVWKRSRSYSHTRRDSGRHRTSRRSVSRDKGSHSHDSSGDRRSSRRTSSRSFSRDRVYRSKSPCYSRGRMQGKKDDYSKKEENKGDGTKSGSFFHKSLGGTSSSTGKVHSESERTPEERNSLTAKQLLEKIQSRRFEKKTESSNETASTYNKVGIKLKDPPQGYFGPKLPPALGNKAMLPLIGKLPTVKKPAMKKLEDLCTEKGGKEEELYLAEPKEVAKEEVSQVWIMQEENPSREDKSDSEETLGVTEQIQTISGETQFDQVISESYIADVSTPTEVITTPAEVGPPDADEAVMMHFAPDPEPFSNYIPEAEVTEIEEDSQEDVDSSVAPFDRQPITFTPEEMEKYSKLQQAAQQHIQQQLLAKQVKSFPTSTAIVPAPTLQQFHIQQPSATATSITTVHHAILQHQAAAAAAMGIHPHAHPQTLAQIHHIPQPHLTPISLSQLTPSLYPGHPATFLTSHPIHIIPASALHGGPLALHPVPHALYPALFAPRPGGAGASALHLHPFLHPIFSSQELQHPPSHGS